jgi:hypothetical protein
MLRPIGYLSFLLILTARITANAQPVLYPLHVGDLWDLSTPNPGDTVHTIYRVVKDTVLPNGKSYAEISGNLFWLSRYQRQQGDSVYMYLPDIGREELFFDFTRSAGDTIALFPRYTDTTRIILLSSNVGTSFGHQVRYWGILVDNLIHAVDDEEYYTVTDSIGVTGISCFCGDPPVLSGAMINGIQYGAVTGVKNEPIGEPSHFSLSINYPNPFNPSTSISFALPERTHVRLQIFNALGQLIETLTDGEKQPGWYSVMWDASTKPSGMYFYRMTAGSFVQTKKALLIR